MEILDLIKTGVYNQLLTGETKEENSNKISTSAAEPLHTVVLICDESVKSAVDAALWYSVNQEPPKEPVSFSEFVIPYLARVKIVVGDVIGYKLEVE